MNGIIMATATKSGAMRLPLDSAQANGEPAKNGLPNDGVLTDNSLIFSSALIAYRQPMLDLLELNRYRLKMDQMFLFPDFAPADLNNAHSKSNCGVIKLNC
jgi:hypothetical protein